MSSSLAARGPGLAAPADAPTHDGARTPRLGAWLVPPVVLAALAGAVWLPFLHRPLSSDESGFLLLAQQWTPGHSLYGGYWVDRPPLLLWLFQLAGHLSAAQVTPLGLTSPGVKLMGATASGSTVLLAGLLGRTLAPRTRHAPAVASLAAAALLADPLLGMPETDGEVLAAPFVVLGLLCFLSALRRPWDRRAVVLTVSAGASATCAALVKQNVVDVFILVGVLVVVGRRGVPRAMARLLVFALGALVALGVALTAAAVHGTSPLALWDAVVVFRLHASAVIGASSTASTSARLSRLASAFLTSGAATVLLVCAVLALLGLRRSRVPGRAALVSAALAMTTWELFGAAMGGSYWLHYLTGLVPGVVLLVCVARPSRRGSTVLAVALTYAVCATSLTWLQHERRQPEPSTDAQVVAFLRAHQGGPGGVVVAFGHPGIVAGSGMTSPYEHLWSLPVRVRDPRLEELQRVMAGPSAPEWVVVAGAGLGSWGLDSRSAQTYLEQHYLEQQSFGDWHIWQRRPPGAPLPGQLPS